MSVVNFSKFFREGRNKKTEHKTVPLTVSYNNGKVKRKPKFELPNFDKFRVDIPLLEYKSEVLTWQDLALRIKTDCKRAIMIQVSFYVFTFFNPRP